MTILKKPPVTLESRMSFGFGWMIQGWFLKFVPRLISNSPIPRQKHEALLKKRQLAEFWVAFVLFNVFAFNADALGPFVSLHVPPFVLAETLGVAVLIGLLSAYVPARAAAKRSIVETLRLVD